MSEVQSWSTDPLPTDLKFSAWSEKVHSLHLNWQLTTPVVDRYSAQIRYRNTPGTQIADCRATSFSGTFDAFDAAAAAAAEIVGIQLHLSGQMFCRYGADEFTVSPGDIFIWANDTPGKFQTLGEHRQLTFMVPRARVPDSLDVWIKRNHCAPAGPGTGLLSIAADSIRGITREVAQISDDDLDRAVTSVLDLLGAATDTVRPALPGKRALLTADVRRYVMHRLDDPGMSVRSIAAAHGISVRTLHLAFAEEGLTLSRWIRQQRLERCRRELAAVTGSTTVTDIAFRWGFTDAAHFSRSFKQAFGVTPSSLMTHDRKSVPSG